MCIPQTYHQFAEIKDPIERINAFKSFNLNLEFRPWCFIMALAEQFCEEDQETAKDMTMQAFKALFEGSGELVLDGYSSFNVSDDEFMMIVDEPYGMNNEEASPYNRKLASMLIEVGFKKRLEIDYAQMAETFNTYSPLWIVDN